MNAIPAKGAHADAVLTAIIRNGVLAVTEEMKTNLMRTAYNMIIYEALDFTVGLFTPDGDTVSIGLGLPMFIRGMSQTVKAKIEKFGKENMREGDIYITNDSYLTGSHLNHFTMTMPVFHQGVLAGFTCCMAHWQDVGGNLGGVTTDIYAEGIQIPIMKCQKEGVINEELLDIIKMNVRIPERAMGDFRAQVTAVKSGDRRYRELLDRYGRDATLAAISRIMDQSEARARELTRSIPDGTYEAEAFMDDDGVDIGQRVPIKVKIIIEGDEATIDLTEVSKQVRGYFNSGPTTGYACAEVAYKCITSPTDYPINAGSFRSLKVLLTPGTVISAVRPAAMRQWMTYPMTIVDSLFKALAPAISERVIAGHHADLMTINMWGISPKDGRFYFGNLGPLGGGWGAKKTEDGMSATVCLNDGDTHNSPMEQSESKNPVIVRKVALREDSGGPGRWRGGLGIHRIIEARAPLTVNTQIDRQHCAPWGLEGGHAALGNRVNLRIAGKLIDDLPNAKVFTRRLEVGDQIHHLSGGGGGFGPPTDREAERVAFDVAEGYISRDVAEKSYGVVLDADGKVDADATLTKRATLAGAN
jgi:N-methylhydantoinase B